MLQALPRSMRDLPAEATSFVGRRRELTEVRRSLGGGRLLTLTGMGGVGKTRLALRAAAGLRQVFPDGVWLAELGELDDTDDVAVKVAAVLGVDIDTALPWAGLAAFLSHKRLMLVLDNCEHLLDSCALLADRLLSASDGLRILATSRQPLGLTSERTLGIAPLAVPEATGYLAPEMLAQYEAIALFADRASAVQPGFTVTEGNRAQVVELCRRLDGVPLAIELTAARVRAFSLPQLLDRLDDSYSLLVTGNRSAPKRHRTLRALVDWSYDLCTPPERTAWSRLSVFAEGFDLAAAAAVAGKGLDGVVLGDVLSGLVEKSILRRTETDGRTRYWMLEAIRRYGKDRLAETGEQETVTRHHREWFRRLAIRADAEWVGPDQLAWYKRVNAESANLRLALESYLDSDDGRQTALELATSLCTHRRACSSLSEGRRWLDRVLVRAPEPTPAKAKALWTNAWLALLQGDCPAARVLLRECRDVAELIGDASATAHQVQISALAELFEGDPAGAVTGFGDAIKLHREAGDLDSARLSMFQQVMSRCFAGDPAAFASIKHTRTLLRPHPATVSNGYLLWYESIERFLRHDRGDPAKPAAQALRIGADAGERWLVALCLETLAWAAADSSENVRAARVFGAAEAMRQTIGSRLSGLAHLRTHHNRCERAVRAAMGKDQFESAYRLGTRLSEKEAISYATQRKPGKASTRAVRDGSLLTSREREIADLVAKGLSNQEIAESLVIGRRTAETHVGHILTKLGFTTRTQIAAWAAGHRRLAAR
ncbi:LuxR C-terminal-related transcriptional regulator [Amycolatopsis sp. NPDC051071]|uniref:ATP-binding protein n=1 Tax=Amycolatopsis sp. NPDC051071 TaxID=3154637 RepID=UPI00342D89F6